LVRDRCRPGSALFPYTTLFRSRCGAGCGAGAGLGGVRRDSVVGLVVALLDTSKKEKLVGHLSADTVRQLEASSYMALRIRRPVFQSDTELENHIVHCTVGENFRNQKPREDFVIYQPPPDANGRIQDQPIMGDKSVGRLICFFTVRFP